MRDYDLDLIQVLWVEDDPEVTEQYPLKAENFGLQLVAYSCWDDAKKALENNFDRWSAIILDAKCKFHQDSEDSAVVFLREALDDISTICVTKKRQIPWYVLTGGELAAAVMADAIVRIIPGVISDEQSALSDSFQDNLLTAPVYTRPAEYNGWKV